MGLPKLVFCPIVTFLLVLDYPFFLQAQHFKNIDYSCDHCGKVYKTRDSFKKHVAVHKRNPGFHGRGSYNPAGRTDYLVAMGEGQATSGLQ